MGFFRCAARFACATAGLFILAVVGPIAALAQATAVLSGTVTTAGRPLPGAAVTVLGSSLTFHAKTDAQGKFALPGIPIGTYNVDVTSASGSSSLRVEVPAAGASITVALTALKEIGRTSVTSRPPLSGGGTDLSLNAESLKRSPASGSLPGLLLQLPGAARGANGVVHMNGDHGDINYVVDGVAIPQELNRTIGTEFDPNNIASVEVLQGAYPAQYGERFASVIPGSIPSSTRDRTSTSTPTSRITRTSARCRSSPRRAMNPASAASIRPIPIHRMTTSATPINFCVSPRPTATTS